MKDNKQNPKQLKKYQIQSHSKNEKVRRRANKENQDPLREGNETERRKKDKKEETKAKIAKIHVETLESHIKGTACQ
ncbi:23552_t:CDS:2, partial [Gigaspora margarita]